MANYDLDYEGSEVQDILDTGKSLEDDGYIFLGTATPSTIPGTPTERVAYVGGPGTYNNFGTTVVVPSGSVVVITYSGSAWTKTVINASLPVSTTLEDNDTTIPTGKAVKTAIDAINTKLGEGYLYAGIATAATNPGTPIGKVFYLARQAGTYTNFGGLTLTEGVNILKYNGTAWSQEQLISIADIYRNPLMGYYECDTAGETAAKTVAATGYVLPATGGSVKIKMANRNTVANATLNINSTGAKPLFYNGQRAGVGNTWDTNEIVEVFYDGTNYQAYNVAGSNGDGVFDISAYNLTDGQPTPYVDLAAALGTDGANVPQSLRKGGMTIKFIQGSVPSSDNKYLQYRLMSDTFSTTESDWQGVDNEPTAESDNLVKSGGVENSINKKLSPIVLPNLGNIAINYDKIYGNESHTRIVLRFEYFASDVVIFKAKRDYSVVLMTFDDTTFSHAVYTSSLANYLERLETIQNVQRGQFILKKNDDSVLDIDLVSDYIDYFYVVKENTTEEEIEAVDAKVAALDELCDSRMSVFADISLYQILYRNQEHTAVNFRYIAESSYIEFVCKSGFKAHIFFYSDTTFSNLITYYADLTKVSQLYKVSGAKSFAVVGVRETGTYTETVQDITDTFDTYFIKESIQEFKDNINKKTQDPSIFVPEKIYAYNGVNTQIFKHAISNVVNPNNYLLLAVGTGGTNYDRLYQIVGIGTGMFTLRFGIKDKHGLNYLAGNSTTIISVSKKSSPAAQKNILLIGDSFTYNSYYPAELRRLLTGVVTPDYSDILDSPVVSDGLTNINFIGTMNNRGIRHEGYYGEYYAFFATNDYEWSGIINQQTQETGTRRNPFWNPNTSDVDFDYYCSENEYSQIDYAVILLGTNGYDQGKNADVYIKKVWDKLKEHNSNIKVIICGRCMATPGYNTYIDHAAYTFAYNSHLQDLCKSNDYKDNFLYVDYNTLLDTQYNMGIGEMDANVRNSKQVTVPVDGIHPNISGYWQISDAVRAGVHYWFLT